MKKIFISVLIGAAFFTAVHAQPPHPANLQNPMQKPTVKQRIAKLNDTLGKALHITAAQQQAIDDAFTQFFASADKMMADNPPPPPQPAAQDEKGRQVQQQMTALQKQRDGAVAKVLAPDAFKKYLEIEKSLRPGGRQEPPPPKQ